MSKPSTRYETCRTSGKYKPISGGSYLPRRLSRLRPAVMQFNCAACTAARDARMAALREQMQENPA